jgi:hypothetical protein
MICEEPLNNKNSIVFHKTRRQTHALCIDCGLGYLKPILEQATNNIRKNIRKNTHIIKCPGSIHCEHRNMCKYKSSILRLVIPECKLSLDIFRLTYVLSKNNAYICPEVKCGQVVEVDKEYVGNKLVCNGDCQSSWCRNCLVSPFHDGKSCMEVEAENNNTENGKLIWQLKTQGKLKFCPQCRSPCMKNSGCNKMICSVCNQKWCWICLETNIDYSHFNSDGVGICNGRLWEGVDENGNENDENPLHIHDLIPGVWIGPPQPRRLPLPPPPLPPQPPQPRRLPLPPPPLPPQPPQPRRLPLPPPPLQPLQPLPPYMQW